MSTVAMPVDEDGQPLAEWGDLLTGLTFTARGKSAVTTRASTLTHAAHGFAGPGFAGLWDTLLDLAFPSAFAKELRARHVPAGWRERWAELQVCVRRGLAVVDDLPAPLAEGLAARRRAHELPCLRQACMHEWEASHG